MFAPLSRTRVFIIGRRVSCAFAYTRRWLPLVHSPTPYIGSSLRHVLIHSHHRPTCRSGCINGTGQVVKEPLETHRRPNQIAHLQGIAGLLPLTSSPLSLDRGSCHWHGLPQPWAGLLVPSFCSCLQQLLFTAPGCWQTPTGIPRTLAGEHTPTQGPSRLYWVGTLTVLQCDQRLELL